MIHLQPTAPVAERVLLPGDPGRALRLAQALIEQPKMLNHNRGLWGYSGTGLDGAPLSIQSTGMGGASTAIIVHELIELGARTLLRVGTCGALDPALKLEQIVIATEALAADGTSRALGAGERAQADTSLSQALIKAARGTSAAVGTIVTHDLFYDDRGLEQGWRDSGALAVEMESSVLFTLAARRSVSAATVLIVSDLVFEPRTRIEPERLELAELEMGRIALSALGIYDHD